MGRRFACVALGVILGSAPVAAQSPVAPDSLRAAFIALEARWDDAIVRKDVATLEGILAPGFIFIDSDGSITGRAELLAGIQSADLEIDPFVTRDVLVRVYDRTAVVTGWFEQSGRYRGQPYRQRSRYTDVYVRQGDIWGAISAHASTLSVQP